MFLNKVIKIVQKIPYPTEKFKYQDLSIHRDPPFHVGDRPKRRSISILAVPQTTSSTSALNNTSRKDNTTSLIFDSRV